MAEPKKKKRKKRKKKKKLSPEEKKLKKLQSGHKSMVRGVFRQTGFQRIGHLADKAFTYDGQKTDFDDVYVYENILVCIEYTTASSPSEHIKPKKIVYDKIESDPAAFCTFYSGLSHELSEALLANYNSHEVIVKIVYCSRYTLELTHKENIPYPVYLDYAELRYFKNITDCVKKSGSVSV